MTRAAQLERAWTRLEHRLDKRQARYLVANIRLAIESPMPPQAGGPHRTGVSTDSARGGRPCRSWALALREVRTPNGTITDIDSATMAYASIAAEYATIYARWSDTLRRAKDAVRQARSREDRRRAHRDDDALDTVARVLPMRA